VEPLAQGSQIAVASSVTDCAEYQPPRNQSQAITADEELMHLACIGTLHRQIPLLLVSFHEQLSKIAQRDVARTGWQRAWLRAFY
jgi:hypothetical protein